ncbi:hypothetical protein JTE88_08455 [Arcanobacterium phocisimile]|uniref:Uncharacterized protein n=1 Tax=Arcanobacterium phocisimile TaxID=1302235 RepID=A0ABX7IJ15_9ACTO|nr:hypothetical protein [Arcanobacterium phocisimile]QRV02090.1 hypothetical protein JTE88_08455 [Arcanobacterium phocisimile]
MTTPNDPYNSANPRPFDDDDILEPIVENTDRLQPEDQSEHVTGETVLADDALNLGNDAPDFGEILNSDQAPAESGESAELPETDTSQWGSPKYAAEPHYSANEFANVEPREDLADPDLPAPGPAQPVAHQTIATKAPSNPNPTLGSYFGDDESADSSAAVAALATAEAATPQRKSVMPVEENDEPAFAPSREDWGADPGEIGEITEIPEEPKGRGWIHTGSFFLTLLLMPLAWYLISDAGARLYLVEKNPWDAQAFAFFPFIELLGGLITLAALWLTARASSLGAQFWGAIVTIAGMVALIVPSLGHKGINWLDAQIGDFNAFTGNVIHHLELDLGTGRVVILGFLLFMTGVATHAARRRGAMRATSLTRREFLLSTSTSEKTENTPAN